MRIGELAGRTGAQAETIRYYERQGLLPDAGRTESNYRVYGEGHVRRLGFIRHCRSLDMTLDEIRTLLRFKDAPQENCGEVNVLLDEHIGHVAARIAELRHLQKELKSLRELCGAARDAADCGILGGIDKAASLAGPSSSDVSSRGHLRGAHGKVGA